MRDLTATELSRMQAAQTDGLPDTGDVVRITRTADGAGGTTEAEATVAADVACRVELSEDNPLVSQFGGVIGTRQLVEIRVPAATDIQAGDRFDTGSNSYEILSVLPVSWETVRTVIAVGEGLP